MARLRPRTAKGTLPYAIPAKHSAAIVAAEEPSQQMDKRIGERKNSIDSNHANTL